MAESTKQYELAAGLVLPGVFGAELVFFFQAITHDYFSRESLVSPGWKYGMGLWFVLYVCTSFMATVTMTDKVTYRWGAFSIDGFEALLSLIAFVVLGFVDADAARVYSEQPAAAREIAFVIIAFIALVGALHSRDGEHRNMRVVGARCIGGGVAVVFVALARCMGPALPTTIAFVALTVCYVALAAYLSGRWQAS